MEALVKYAAGQGFMELRDVPEPTPGPGQVKIEVKAAGVCGSDLHIYHDDIAIPVNPPVVTGHEFSGVVADVGEGVDDWKPGDRVTSETAFSFCGRCVNCITGFYNLCAERRVLGYWYDGAFARYTVVPQERVHALPVAVDFVAGALTEPLACIAHAVLELTRITVGDVVLVSGPGAIGLGALQVARSQGARVIVSGTGVDRERLAMAEKLGADGTIDVEKQDIDEEMAGYTEGRGADVVLECSGAGPAVQAGLRVLKKRGRYTQIGLFGRPVTADWDTICYRELQVTGSLGSKWTSWMKAIELIASGSVNAKALVSHELPLREWARAFSLFEKKEGIKIVLIPA